MEEIVYVGRLRKRGTKFIIYEITVPKKVVASYGLQPGDLLEVRLVPLGVDSPGWYKDSFERMGDSLFPELDLLVKGSLASRKHKSSVVERYFGGRVGGVGRGTDKATEEALRHARGEG